MTPEQVIDRVRQDKGIKSRFPLRIIFVDQFDQYKMITNKLAAICDGTINIADFCGGTDTYPDFAKIQNLLIEQPSRQIQLLGMGEYLRFAFSREKNAQRRQLIGISSKMRKTRPESFCQCMLVMICGNVLCPQWMNGRRSTSGE